jgi:hypothetical protein
MVAGLAPWIFVASGRCAPGASLQRVQTVDRATINKRIDRAAIRSVGRASIAWRELTLAPRRPPDFPTSASLSKAVRRRRSSFVRPWRARPQASMQESACWSHPFVLGNSGMKRAFIAQIDSRACSGRLPQRRASRARALEAHGTRGRERPAPSWPALLSKDSPNGMAAVSCYRSP